VPSRLASALCADRPRVGAATPDRHAAGAPPLLASAPRQWSSSAGLALVAYMLAALAPPGGPALLLHLFKR
jgi:hypothetical protein